MSLSWSFPILSRLFPPTDEEPPEEPTPPPDEPEEPYYPPEPEPDPAPPPEPKPGDDIYEPEEPEPEPAPIDDPTVDKPLPGNDEVKVIRLVRRIQNRWGLISERVYNVRRYGPLTMFRTLTPLERIREMVAAQ
jgi:hypothetical protein